MAAELGIVASLVGPVIELGKLIVTPIKRQFNYLCCFTSNIQSLKDEAKKLEDVRDGLQSRVDAAKRNAEEILPEIETWLTNANQIHVSFSGIENDIPKVQNGFLKTKSRFSLSRKAKKMSEDMKNLQCAGKLDHISQPAPPLAMGSIPIGQVYEFETRKQIEEDIMEALRGGEVNMLGLCGMGGVGKTTMAKRIMNRVREENLFDEILMAVVSQSFDMLKIQREISESLGLNFTMESLSNRAHQLRTRLTGTKRILMVLDDVWERLEMEDLGIPCETGVKGCTVLLTSRDRDVFEAMDIRKVCALQILPEREAWSLFKEKVGSCLDDQDLVSIAEEVAKECKGLPIALVTVGMALKNKKRKSIWKDALQQLKSSNPVDMPNVVRGVYNPLRLSYDFLDKSMPGAKFVFLFCSLFPEDSDISLKELTCYLMGLGILEGIGSLEHAKNRVCLLVELLKSRFLLQDGKNECYVKMHDVVRDVAIFIASQEELIPKSSSIDWSIEHSYSNCKWILTSSREIELPMVLDVPSLRLLIIRGEIQMHDRFFEVMKELNVLSISIPSRSLPETMQLLKNLRTLILKYCSTLESVSVVGELLSLEILSCSSCDSIAELPAEIGRLTRLRSLEFSYCKNLKRVAPGLISNLVRLEELKMRSSFKGWKSDKNGKERRNNASLNELQSLSNLTCLEIEIEDCTLAAEEMHLSPKIVKYYINFTPRYSVEPFKKRISMRWPKDVIILGDWILNLLRKNNEYLELIGDGSNNLDLAQVQKMKRFDFHECSTVTKLVSTTSIDWRFGVLPTLESLRLRNLPNLEEICDGPIQAGSNSFKSLKEIELYDVSSLKYLWDSRNQKIPLSNLSSIVIGSCDNLRSLFPLQMALQLKRLSIWRCPLMEEVFSKENKNDGEVHITFPRLENLSLRDLRRLTTLCKGIESIEYPLLTEMEIEGCPKLTSFVCSTGNNLRSLAGHSDDSFHLFCDQKVTFGSLKSLCITEYKNISNLWCHQIPPAYIFSMLEEIKIVRCGIIKSLFSSSIAANLVNLKRLEISDCNKMVKVIGDEENVSDNIRIFPSLQFMALRSLPNLVNFCGWRCPLHLPSLSIIEIITCPQMERFTMSSLTTPSLKFIQMNSKFFNKKDVEDLNGVVQLSFGEKIDSEREREMAEESFNALPEDAS